MIKASTLTGYDPTSKEVSLKYTPLLVSSINISGDAELKELINSRKTFLGQHAVTADNKSKITLYQRFYGNKISKCLESEEKKVTNAGKCVPPLVIISSNRSDWIKKEYNKMISNPKKPQNNKGISDLGYLMKPAPPANFNDYYPTPIYFPERLQKVASSGKTLQSRSIYVFVISDEYETYYNNLKDIPNLKVIAFTTNSPPFPDFHGMFGFGMSRYAAIEFMKYLNKKSSVKGVCDQAWMIDDTVTYLSGGRNLEYFEGKLGSDVAMGFNGSNEAKDIVRLYNKDNDQKSLDLPSKDKPLIQQMVLLNIKELSNASFNYDYSPYFILSGEDYSFTQISKKNGLTINLNTNFQIHKGLVPKDKHDNTQILTDKTNANNNDLNVLFDREKSTVIGKSSDNKNLGSLLKDLTNGETPSRTCAKAVEEILRTGILKIGNGANWPTKDTYNVMFNIESVNVLLDC